MKKLNYSDFSERVITCTSLENLPENTSLHLGQRYKLKNIIKEEKQIFINIDGFSQKFDAHAFSEVFSSMKEVEKELHRKSRKKKLLAITGKVFPKLVLGANALTITPEWGLLSAMHTDDLYTIGSSADCSLQINQAYISGIHCYIYKTEDGRYGIVDCSVYGTYLMM